MSRILRAGWNTTNNRLHWNCLPLTEAGGTIGDSCSRPSGHKCNGDLWAKRESAAAAVDLRSASRSRAGVRNRLSRGMVLRNRVRTRGRPGELRVKDAVDRRIGRRRT